MDDNVTFKLGSVNLGTVSSGNVIVTPYTLFPNNFYESINLARLLQSINTEEDSEILIIDTSLEELIPENINFGSASFESDIQAALNIVLISYDVAKENMNESIEVIGGKTPFSDNTTVANAGTDQNTSVGTNVFLDASASYNVDGEIINYEWGILLKPEASNVSLSNLDTVNPNFIADKDGVYIFQLVVNDGKEYSGADVVRVSASVAPNPVVDQNATVDTLVTLDALLSSDSNSDNLAYFWRITSMPSGSDIVLSDRATLNPTFTPDTSGEYVFSLTVNDGISDSISKEVIVSASVTILTSFTTKEDTQYNGVLTGNDIDGDSPTFTKISDPINGTVSIDSNGTFTYIPRENFNGTDTFTYKINGTDTQVVDITVDSVNDVPTFTSHPVAISYENQKQVLTLTAIDSDSSTLTYSITGLDSDSFHIDSTSGLLQFKTEPKYDTQKSYQFIATVSDGLDEVNQNITVHVIEQRAFITVWEVNSINTSITIPINPNYAYNYTIDWGDGSMDFGVINSISHIYKTEGNYRVKINGIFPAIYFNDVGDKEKIINIDQWGDIEWESMQGAFNGCENLELSATDIPNLSSVTDMSFMFAKTAINQSLEHWDVSSITNMKGMFYSAVLFNQNIDSWDVSSVINMSAMFAGAKVFNQPLVNWEVSKVTDMSSMFSGAEVFDQALDSWDVSSVLNMSSMFFLNYFFNQSLDSWDVSSVLNMSNMFSLNYFFNQSLDSWDVSNVVDMGSMFSGTKIFNQPLGNWDVSKVTDMSSMFSGAVAYNQSVSNWDVSKVTDMNYMFYLSGFRNQDLSSWDISNVQEHTSFTSGSNDSVIEPNW